MSSRIWSYISDEVNAELLDLAADIGVTKSVMIALSVKAGIATIKRAFYPEKVITADMWAMILESNRKLDLLEKDGG